MSTVRVVARVRPLVNSEIEKDVIVTTDGSCITIPNPKNEKENFRFPFNSVLGSEATQAEIFSEGRFSFGGRGFMFWLHMGNGIGSGQLGGGGMLSLFLGSPLYHPSPVIYINGRELKIECFQKS